MDIEVEKAFVNRCEKELPEYVEFEGNAYKMTCNGLMSGGFRVDYGQYDGVCINWNVTKLISIIGDDEDTVMRQVQILLLKANIILLADIITYQQETIEILSDAKTAANYSNFESELRVLLNRHCMENGSNTPDYILASYLLESIKTFNNITKLRERFYGR